MRSMTGFGKGESSDGAFAAEISGVNRKQLEIRVSMPAELQCFEAVLRSRLSARVSRGSINVRITAGRKKAHGKVLDVAALTQIVTEARAAAEKLNISPEIRIGELLQLPSVFSDVSSEACAECPPELLEAFDKALDAFDRMRLAEGDNLASDFAARIAAVEAMTLDLYKYSDGLTIRIRDKLLDVLKDSGLNVDLNDERMLKEVVFFADKADVTEELTRLASHCTQFREFMRSEEAVGRSLDFLMQEMFREITTYGNKASGTGASKLVVDFKTALEKLREQIQNVE